MKIYIYDITKQYTRKELHNIIYGRIFREIKRIYNVDLDFRDLCYGERGKPYVKNKEIFFSVSYGEKMVVFALSKKRIGIDIERIKKCDKGIVKYLYSSDESSYLYNSINIDEAFYEIWTYKEAIVKYVGCGIDKHFRELNTIDENYCSTGPAPLISMMYKDYILAVCCEDVVCSIEVNYDKNI